MKRNNSIKFYHLALFGIFAMGVLFYSSAIHAVNCGDTTGGGSTRVACSCGDTVTTSATLQASDSVVTNTCSGNGLVVGAHSITIDGSGYTITGNGSANSGIHDSGGYDSIIIQNINITNFQRGIQLQNSSSSTIKNNTITSAHFGVRNITSSGTILTNNIISSAFQGIYIQGSSSLEIGQAGGKGNTIKSSSYGLWFITSSSNTITENRFLNNMQDIYSSGLTNIYSSNTVNYNVVSKMLSFTSGESDRTVNVEDTVSFSVSAFALDGSDCDGCTTITTLPSETVAIDTESGNDITAHFVPSRSGIYSLNFTITDSNSNVTKKTTLFFVGDTDSQSVRYYLRSTTPTHGQSWSIGGFDTGTFISTEATSVEQRYCTGFIQYSPDEIPNYPLANLSSISLNIWYKVFPPTAAYVGIQRYSIYDATIDPSSSVNYSPIIYTWLPNKNFTNVNWGMDFPYSWYGVTAKATGNNPDVVSFPSSLGDGSSYADFAYEYTTTPALKTISNADIVVLSATEPADDAGNATIVVENPTSSTASTNIVLNNYKRPFQNYTTTISLDGTTPIATIAANNITAGATTTLNSVKLDIIPNAGTIAVSSITWNTQGTYSKQWTETGAGVTSATHTIGDLQANTYYNVFVDGSIQDSYLSDESGQITFTYSGGYSAKTFAIQQETSAPTNVGISSVAVDSSSQLTVTANTATDSEPGLHATPYRFKRNSTELDWQESSILEDTGLSPNTQYAYYVKARDAAGNESSYSSTSSKYTLAPTPTSFAGGSISSSITLTVAALNNQTSGSSGYYFISSNGTNSGWIQTNTWQDTNLLCNTSYSYTVKYSNADGTETSTIPLTATTLGCGGSSFDPGPVFSQTANQPNNNQTTNQAQLEELFSKITALKSKIALLQQQLGITNNQQNNNQILACPLSIFTRNLKKGMTGQDVKCLQILLNKDPDTKLAYSGPGSLNKETTLFGILTYQAVIKFQEKYREEILLPLNLLKGTGRVGSYTLKVLDKFYEKE